MSLAAALGLFGGGVVLVVLAADWLVDGLVGIAGRLGVSVFALSALLSGLEAENIAVGLAAGARGDAEVALGMAYGGTIVVVTLALGGGALVTPLRVTLPGRTVVACPLAALAAGLPLVASPTPRWAGAVLVLGYASPAPSSVPVAPATSSSTPSCADQPIPPGPRAGGAQTSGDGPAHEVTAPDFVHREGPSPARLRPLRWGSDGARASRSSAGGTPPPARKSSPARSR